VAGVQTANCTAQYTTGSAISTPNLVIKKSAQGRDGQTLSDAANVAPGGTFNYTYEVKNTGSGSATGVTITDTFPRYVSITAVPTGIDWTCTTGTKIVGTGSYATVICSYNKILTGGAIAPTVTVPAKVDILTPPGTALRNIAYVCRIGDTIPECNPTCIDPNNSACNPPPPPVDCSSPDVGPNKDPACVVTPPGAPYVTIKKYAGTLDSQDATGALAVVPGTSFNYRYDVSNTGTVAATGVVVTDTLPHYVSINSITKPAGWTCAQGTKTVATVLYPTIVCTTATLAAGTSASLTINVTLAASTPANAQLRNIAYVCKAGDAPTLNCDPTCIVDPTHPRCNPPPPPPNCDPMPGSPNYDPACVVTVSPSCDRLASLPSGSTLSTSIDVTYTCTATGAIAVPANLEYSIKCGAGDTSSGSAYTGSNIRVCRTPSTSSTSQTMTCAVRDKTNTGVVFSGSEIGACNVTKTTSG
jgi:uncharacterized repeat protein (TIGR01451 family)